MSLPIKLKAVGYITFLLEMLAVKIPGYKKCNL